MSNLQKKRKAKKISQVALAKKLKITSQAISIAEKKGLSTMSAARRYAKILNCNPFELLD